ncbi:Spo7-domain-containing protein [Metschnikowia bicuspidata var. bicuspidata NRRL YB-4993]|uniref:Spo7-domain-containing protein n=1 Tax=Metschnikowia bicuspidata var. bicuspidata NRRL YB-4993 TaxID=869754 RepID=A0A1A0HD79_9ASCO|nr:Spo7-domain-containing protein [Metschnikowia bicuspidata var. bicuspidata NRRL YB-4993]OBA21971.1 Spo7-domain-containing protein [Metschnikowia bicuspidata var. bicuspidata NRRL YB-4993]
MELSLPSSAQGHEKTDVVFYSSALDSESQLPTKPRGARHKNAAGAASVLPPLLPRAKKLGRRRSKPASDAASERSHRSEKSHRSELPQGGGYTLTPATGKIFRNLLILEESLRQQVVQQRTLRRKYLTFLAALCALVASVSYLLYFAAPRGPLRAFLQLILLTLVVTLLLYHLLGEYQKTIVLPRKFLSSINKGLRQLNVRLIKTKLSLANRTADLARELGLFLCIMALKLCHSVSPSMARNPSSRLEVWLVSVQLRCQPRFGLNDIKLVLVPRSFSTDIREGWELYRDEFWIKEGIRRRNYLLDFTRATAEAEKKPWRKDKKERRKRKSSVVQRASASEQNLNTLDLMSLEASPPPL